MIVQCPSCDSRYRVNDANVPPSGGKITCPSCQHRFIVYPEGAGPGQQQSSAIDDLEDKTSVAHRPDLQQLVNQMGGQQGGQQGGQPEGGGATEVMSGDSLPDFFAGQSPPEDGTVEMKNPFENGLPGSNSGGQGQQQDAAATEVFMGEEAEPTEVVSADAVDQMFRDGIPKPQPNQQQQPPNQQQQPPAQQQQSPTQQQSQPQGGASAPSVDDVDGPAGPDAQHDGPWKLKTNFGLTYEFPDTKSLRNWLSNREDLDGYELSGDGDNFHGLDEWPQIADSANSSGSRPAQPASFQDKTTEAPALNAGGAQTSNASSPSAGFGSSAPPSQPASPGMGEESSEKQPGKKIKPKEYRPPSRDGKWNVVLWGVFLVLLVVAAGIAAQVGGYYDVKGLIMGGSQPANQATNQEPAAPAPAAAQGEGQQEPAAQAEAQAQNDKIAKEVDRLLEDAERALNNNRLQTASEKLQNAKLLDPERVEVYEMLAKVYDEMGQAEQAEAAKKKASELQHALSKKEGAAEEASNN